MFFPFSGWEQPDWYSVDPTQKPEYKPSFGRTNWFEAVQKEYSLVSEKVGLIDLTPFAKIKVSGVEARAYLDYLLSGTVPKVGRTTLAHALTVGGKVMAEFTVTGLEESNTFMVVTGSGVELHDLRHMEEVAREGNYDVQIENVTDDLGVLSVAGPLSGHVFAKALENQDLVDQWKFLDAKKCNLGGVECLAVRISYTGELGWEFYMPRNQMKPVYDALMNSGREYGIGHFGTFVVNTFRLVRYFFLHNFRAATRGKTGRIEGCGLACQKSTVVVLNHNKKPAYILSNTCSL